MNWQDHPVADLDEEAFRRCAHHIAAGRMRIYFQPGDATRYQIEVGPTSSVTVSNGEFNRVLEVPAAHRLIRFGTESAMHSFAVCHADHPGIDHPWTAMVWARLWDTVKLSAEGVTA